MSEGTVMWFSNKRGYGFIQKDDGGDIFVHHSAIKTNGYKTLKEGQRVSFEIVEGKKGLTAVEVESV